MKRVRPHLLLSLCCALLLPLSFAYAQDGDPAETELNRIVEFSIQPQGLDTAMVEFANQSGIQVVTPGEELARMRSPGVTGSHSAAAALERLLFGTGVEYEAVGDATIALTGPALNGAVAGQKQNTIGQRRPGIEEIIVTGQKREERIQDVPIAISAFSMEDLEAQKLEGGFDLLKAIPNVTFSKTNFTGYNFSIRGIGTQAISATTDPGVAVAFNSTGLIQNRLFEQEYVDIERVEVLRGPQGTLYGRNATAGVINVITRKPELNVFDAAIEGEIGNYNTQRLRGHVNIPLIDDMLAARLAYASTDRDGYDYNIKTDNQVNGRDLWTGRLTLGFQPTDRIRADLVWEHFEEDDNRSRTGKQLCHRDPGVSEVDGFDLTEGDDGPGFYQGNSDVYRFSLFSQGCLPGSLYADEAFGTPNGLALPFLTGVPIFAVLSAPHQGPGGPETILKFGDPYGGKEQSRDLRTIESVRDPVYRAEADIFQLNIDFDITDTLTLTSQTAYNEDEVYSFQDFNRFNTVPIFRDTTNWGAASGDAEDYSRLAPGGVFCDPQIGCSDSVAGFDISQASSEQFSQELRIQSAFSGPINFSLGANYTEFETLNDYYVMYNILTLVAALPVLNHSKYSNPIDPANRHFPCGFVGGQGLRPGTVDYDDPLAGCPFIDPNPVDTSRNFGTGGNHEGEGHNYFRSKNPYELESWAAFGELYWNITDALKLTAGLRYTNDEKSFTPVPTQVLLSRGAIGGGTINRGYPEKPPIEQEWGEWTGRLVLDWQPEPVFDWQDEALLYASYSRGYKGGGANPPLPGFATAEENLQVFDEMGDLGFPFTLPQFLPVLSLPPREYGDTFDAEFVNAFEIGSKNTLFGGVATVNMTAFYYDYQDYQVSQIRDRTAVNENFDAEIWGLELETAFALTENFRMLANVGYLKTSIDDGEQSLDIMNRTQDNDDFMVVKPWLQYPSNCVVPTHVVKSWAQTFSGLQNFFQLCYPVGGLVGLISGPIFDPVEGGLYNSANYDGTNGFADINNGLGVFADLGGNELPNSPRLTANIGAEYGRDILDGSWRLTLRTDVYRQSKSWARIYNLEPYDRLQSWYNANISARVTNESLGWEAEFYVKNLLDKTPITGAFLNSDDTGLTTNVFTLDPRLVGFSLRKEF